MTCSFASQPVPRPDHRNPTPAWIHALMAPLLLAGAAIAGAQDTVAVPVELAAVERGPLDEELVLSGTLTAQRDAGLSPRIEGLVAALAVDAGARVKRGDLLLELDDRLARLALTAADAELAAAEATVGEAQRRVREAEPLVAQRSLPETELAARRAQLAQAGSARDAARAAAETRRELLARHRLRAPFDGVVATRLVDIGEWVSANQSVLQLVSLAPVLLDVQAPQERFLDLHEGVAVQIEADVGPAQRRAGRIVARVPVTSGAGARSFLLRIEAIDDSEGLLPGTSARAHFTLGGAVGLRIARAALQRHPDGGFSVYVVQADADGMRAQRRSVRIGREAGAQVEVLEGLDEGDRIVVAGSERLSDGQPIRDASDGSQGTPAG